MARTSEPKPPPEPHDPHEPRWGREGPRGDWRVGLASVAAAMTPDKVMLWAVVGTLGFAIYFGGWRWPAMQENNQAAFMRLVQEESERNREAGDRRDRTILEEFRREGQKARESNEAGLKFLFQSVVALGKQMASLEAAVERLNKRMETKEGCACRELMPMPGAEYGPITETVATVCRLAAGLGYVIRQYENPDD